MFALLTYFSYILKGYKPGVCFGVFLGFLFLLCVCCLFVFGGGTALVGK